MTMSRYQFTAATNLLACLLFGGACGGSGGGSQAIASGPLAGKVGGQPWSLVSGETDAFLSMGNSDFFTTLYTESVATCTGAGFSVTSNQLIIEVPMAPGDYTQAMTFVDNSQAPVRNLITTGHVVVDQVTATTVTGGAFAKVDANNTVSGQFQATVCAQ
jgi:hypothetical protein